MIKVTKTTLSKHSHMIIRVSLISNISSDSSIGGEIPRHSTLCRVN